MIEDLKNELDSKELLIYSDNSYLKNKKIPYCIASMAPRSNFDFYLDR